MRHGCVARRLCVLLAVAASLAASSAALADPQKEREPSRDEVIKFPDDPLGAEALGARTVQIKVRPKAAQGTLIRPRLQFVTEMLRSAESF